MMAVPHSYRDRLSLRLPAVFTEITMVVIERSRNANVWTAGDSTFHPGCGRAAHRRLRKLENSLFRVGLIINFPKVDSFE